MAIAHSRICLIDCCVVVLFASAAPQRFVDTSDGPTSNGVSPGHQTSKDSPRKSEDETCAPCHQKEALTFAQTEHHRTSSFPSQESIRGSFAGGSNELKIADPAPVIGDPGLTYKMTRSDSSFLVSAITGFTGQTQTRTEAVGLVIGSGVRGQSYLYWKGDSLFELPVSYWSDGNRWINSPGFRNGPPNFDRPASPRCLECHMTFMQTISNDPASNRYEKSKSIPGISCETCHGPGAAHIAAHHAHTPSTNESIVNPAKLSRDRQVDLCSLCHSGVRQPSGAGFAYVPGNPLDTYLGPSPHTSPGPPDVHGNQVGLLRLSRCYLASTSMTCSTCHQVHRPEEPASSYSSRCMSCHKSDSCGMFKKLGRKIESNCIDCHMPMQLTQAIISETDDTVIRTTMRTHRIAVYSPANIQ
jgi:hypothetical protein